MVSLFFIYLVNGGSNLHHEDFRVDPDTALPVHRLLVTLW
jgi:hypothetical protein